MEFEAVASLEKDGYYLRRFSLGEHSATHMNAPNSFHSSGMEIEQYPAESLVVPAVVMDIRDKAAVNLDYALTIADVIVWEQQYGLVPFGSVVLLSTGWQDKWEKPDAFLNQDIGGRMHFPGFGSDTTQRSAGGGSGCCVEQAQFLLNERQIAGVGIDTHGVDSGQNKTFATNSLVLEQPRIVLENLTHLEQLPPTGTTLVLGLLRLRGGSGSPAAVMALVP